MGVLIDTSVIIAEERGGASLASAMKLSRGSPMIAAITASELLVGVLRANPVNRRKRETFVEGILARIVILPFDLETARHHARLSVELAASGTPVGSIDLIIAATAVASGCALITRDRRSFSRIPGLETILV